VKILWTEPAGKDLDHIEDFIKEDNPVAAVNVVLSIIDAVDILLFEHSHIGKTGRVDGTREWVVPAYPSYIIVYRVNEDNLEIIRILHGAQKWADKF